MMSLTNIDLETFRSENWRQMDTDYAPNVAYAAFLVNASSDFLLHCKFVDDKQHKLYQSIQIA